MPKIERLTARAQPVSAGRLGLQIAAGEDRGIAQQQIGQVLQETGRVVRQVVNAADRQLRFRKEAEAEEGLAQIRDEARNAKDLRDSDAREKFFDDQATALRNTLSKGLTLTSAQEFRVQFDVAQMRSKADLRRGVMDDSVSEGRANTMAAISQYARLAANATEDSDREYYADRVREAISSADESGFLRPGEEISLRAQFQEEFTEHAQRVATQRAADEIMQSEVTLQGRLERVRSIGNPELRERVNSRVKLMTAENEAAEREIRRRATESAWDAVFAGESIPEDVEASDRLQMERYQLARAKSAAGGGGFRLENDPVLIAEIQEQAVKDPQAFVRRNLLADAHRMTRSELNFWKKQQDAMRGGDDQARASFAGGDVDFLTRQIDALEIEIDKGQTGRISVAWREWLTANPEATLDEKRNIVNSLLQDELTVPGTGFFGFFNDKKRLGDFTSDDVAAVVADPPGEWVAEIHEEARRKHGRRATQAEIRLRVKRALRDLGVRVAD